MNHLESLQMLTQSEVAKVLNCNKDTVTMLRENGLIKAIKTGRNYMYSQKEMQRFMDDYAGLDISSLNKAIEAYNEVQNKKRLEKLIS